MNNLLMSIEYTFIVLNTAVQDFEEVNFKNGNVPTCLTEFCVLTQKADKMARFNINKFMERDIRDIKKAYYDFDIMCIANDNSTSRIMKMPKSCKNEEDLQEYREYSKMFYVIRQKMLYLKHSQMKRIKTSNYKELFAEIQKKFNEVEALYMETVFYEVS
ncbi:hypothetical protein [Cetobacterium sp.]|uniref:hypothetical protein n=1 Tax=Cetobacterium sp. TaxID=2071632 RepID=UPI003F3E34E0